MKTKPETIDEYLAPLSEEKRNALEKLRKAIKSAAPKAEECISYQIPAFRLNGKLLVAFGVAVKHCAFYPGALPVKTHKNELKGYDTIRARSVFNRTIPCPRLWCGSWSRLASRSTPSVQLLPQSDVRHNASEEACLLSGCRGNNPSCLLPGLSHFRFPS